jgi:hypothetical protein
MWESAPKSHFWEEQIGPSVTLTGFCYSLLQMTLDSSPLMCQPRFGVTKPLFLSRSGRTVFFFLFFSDCSNRRDEYDI